MLFPPVFKNDLPNTGKIPARIIPAKGISVPDLSDIFYRSSEGVFFMFSISESIFS
jgi:hypothetical protein